MTETEESEKEPSSSPSDEALCKGCDANTPLDDIGLCSNCAAKLERDFIRQRDWDYSVSTFRLPVPKREELRRHVIKQHGPHLELIVDDKPRKRRRRYQDKKGPVSKTESDSKTESVPKTESDSV